MTQIKLKRVYDDNSEEDGSRVLVDRLWPRGISKEQLKYDLWAKDITPSSYLRKWFHQDIDNRWDDFLIMYRKELSESNEVKLVVERLSKYAVVTLLYASREAERNHAVILKSYLDGLLGKVY